MARPYLELTKLQRQLVFDMIRNQGYVEGVPSHTLYQHLRRILGIKAGTPGPTYAYIQLKCEHLSCCVVRAADFASRVSDRNFKFVEW